MLKILIADDHPVSRRGLRHIIEETSDLILAGEAADGREALHEALTGDYDVVLLDITMPHLNGLEVLSQLKKERPHLPVLMLTIHPEEQYAVRSLRAGASGYLTKESAPEELVAAIRKVALGGHYVSAPLAEHLAYVVQIGGQPRPYGPLSRREHQVVRLLASGTSVSEAARELSLSPKTVSTHRAHILKKLNLKNNADITRWARTELAD
ncbi:MAG: response regulator transcription factor [Actinobacteria bacterium]|nr:response regulator transcription factor [Actinomycetota bacterium]